MKRDSIVFTNENCIGCNKCINVCSAIGACISKEENGKARIEVDGSKCVACGSCIDVCVHGAREFEDDTERFFRDLKNGEKISLLLAPAFKANYPDEYKSVLGGLKDLGVQRIISVSFGADITTWGYLNYIEQYDFAGGISQPCPALVSYIERYLPELLPRLFPVQSPLMCAAIYARKELGITDRFAFISPCIAKKIEIEDPHNAGLVQYNVTFEHLMRYVKEHDVKGASVHSEIEYGLGSFYPTPGGLAENVKWFLGDEVFIRQVEGERHLYEWLHQNEDRIKNRETPFLFIDALNCEKGCICGTAVNPEKSETDDALYALLKIREESKKNVSGEAWSRPDTPKERLEQFNRQFEKLDLNDYLRGYTDRSEECRYVIPDEKAFDAIFISMNKLTEESRNINCSCCGYQSCRQMATAIYNGFNHRENCIYYEKMMVHELEMEKAVAEEATRAKSSFLANMSHEIRTPINAVLGMNEMILRECEDQNIVAYSESIRSAGNTLLGLVNNILDFSKIEAGKMEIQPVDYDLSSVINDLVNMVQNRADEKGLTLSLMLDPKIPKSLYGDEIRVKQIITNILTNAVKYTEKGTITFRMDYEKTEGKPDHVNLLVSVEDTGIGIKEEDISRLFEQFDRIEEKRNRNIEGTGLGMNITLKLLEMMGSTLNVESTYGSGSKFSFALDQKVNKWEELGDYAEAYRRLVGQKKAYTEKFVAPEAEVLVIDDNPMNLMVFKSLLKQTRVKVDTANSGDEGLTLALDKKYDIIFFDHMMPEKDGIETLREMRVQNGNPNVETISVCLTANAITGAREYYMEAGFDDYLTKPIDSAKLENMLYQYLPKEKIVSDHREDMRGPEVEKIEDADLAELAASCDMDVKKGIENSGSADSYIALLKIFYESMEEKCAELDRYFEKEDFDTYTIKVHALKSSARIIGAAELGEKAQKLENAGKSGDADYIRENHYPFLEHYMSYEGVLKKLTAKKKAEADGKKSVAGEAGEIVLTVFQHSVFVKGIIRKMNDLGYHVDVIDDRLEEGTQQYLGRASLFLFYLPSDITENSEKKGILRALGGEIKEKKEKLILIGEKKYREDLMRDIPALSDFAWINRPLDMNLLEQTVAKEISGGEGFVKKRRVLIVDDDPSYAKMVREWIGGEYRVDLMTSGAQAMRFLQNLPAADHVDLILLDHQMPEMDGPEVFRQLKQNEKTADIPVIFLTGVSTEDRIAEIASLNPRGYLFKNTTRAGILEYLKDKIDPQK